MSILTDLARSRRSTRSFHSLLCITGLLTAGLSGPFASGQQSTQQDPAVSLATYLPSTTAIYLELAPAGQWLNHPLRTQVTKSPTFLELWRSPDALELRGGMTMAELALGDTLESLAQKLTHGGWAFAVDRKHEGRVLLTRAENAEWLKDYLAKLIKLARGEDQGGGESAVAQSTYRGIAVYQLDKTVVFAKGDILIATDKPELGREILDGLLDQRPRDASLASVDFYQQALAQHAAGTPQAGESATQLAWLAVDLDVLRQAGVAKELFMGKADDFGTELFIGGVLGVLHMAPWMGGTLNADPTGVQLSLATPYDHQWVGDEREHFVGPEGNGAAAAPLWFDEGLATLSVYRDMSQMWLRAGDLFGERVNDEIAQADGTLTTLFSGRDFGLSILGAIYPELQFIMAEQTFDEAQHLPSIKLPSLAVVARLREPDVMGSELKRIFQSLVGFLNVIGAMDGQPQLDLDSLSVEDNPIYTAAYVRAVDATADRPVPIQFNFSPSIAFVEDRVIIASTLAQATQLVHMLDNSGVKGGLPQSSAQPQTPSVNTFLRLGGPAVHAALAANREQMIAQNMLEKGHTRDEAEVEIGALLAILEFFEAAELTLEFNPQMRLEVDLTILGGRRTSSFP